MDLHYFLHNGGHISLMAFRSAYSYLNAIQLEKNHIEYDDICQGVLLGADLNKPEIAVHNILICEAAVLGFQHTDGSRRMRLCQTDIDGEASFIQNILRILNLIVPGSFFPAVETFRMDCDRYYLNPKNRTSSTSPRATRYSQRDRRRDNIGNVSTKYNQALMKSVTFAPQSSASKEADAAMIAAQKDNFEICEQGIRFLAEIRRGGMDVLFPQIKHDKVLAIIFTVFTLVKTTAHKELIDLIMGVKDCGTISNLECVSKTKVRGVIALLKLAMIIETHGGSNEKIPVTLTLSASTDSIETLREQHDEFLMSFGTTQPLLWREEVYWEKLVWGQAFTRRLEKLKEMRQFVPLLLACAPMRPVVDSMPVGRVKEIFITREDALENDSLYHSFSFKFHMTEDEKDNSGVTVNSSPLSPDTIEQKMRPINGLITHLSTFPFNLDGDTSTATTSNDEWSVGSSPPLPIRPEYINPLLTVIPIGSSKTYSFAHSPTVSTAMSTPMTTPISGLSSLTQDFLPSIIPNFTSQSYPPKDALNITRDSGIRDNGMMDTGVRLLLGDKLGDKLGVSLGDITGTTGGTTGGSIGTGGLSVISSGGSSTGKMPRYNYDSPDVFGDLSFRSPSPPKPRDEDDWRREFYQEASPFVLHSNIDHSLNSSQNGLHNSHSIGHNGHGYNGDDDRGYLSSPIGRRNTLPNPPASHFNSPHQTQPTHHTQNTHNTNQYQLQHPHQSHQTHNQGNNPHNYGGQYSRTPPDDYSPVHMSRHHSVESFHSDHFHSDQFNRDQYNHVKVSHLYQQHTQNIQNTHNAQNGQNTHDTYDDRDTHNINDRDAYQRHMQQQQSQRLRDSRRTISIQQLPEGRGGTLAPTFYHPSPLQSPPAFPPFPSFTPPHPPPLTPLPQPWALPLILPSDQGSDSRIRVQVPVQDPQHSHLL